MEWPKPVFFAFALFVLLSAVFAQVSVVEVSPQLKSKNLEIEIILLNKSDSDKQARISFFFDGQVSDNFEKIPGQGTKKLTYEVRSVSPGSVLLEIESDENKSFELAVPFDLADGKVPAKEISSEEKSALFRSQKGETENFEKLKSVLRGYLGEGYATIIFLALVFIAIAIVVGFKALKKDADYAKKEKEVKSNMLLLDELDKIKEKRTKEN